MWKAEWSQSWPRRKARWHSLRLDELICGGLTGERGKAESSGLAGCAITHNGRLVDLRCAPSAEKLEHLRDKA